jgi:hypothetical protein
MGALTRAGGLLLVEGLSSGRPYLFPALKR